MMNLLNNYKGRPSPWLVVAVIAVVATMAAVAVEAQDDPVTVDFTVTGDTLPGEMVSIEATVTINDGSMLQNVVWSQVGGVDVVLSDTTTNTVGVMLASRADYKAELLHVLEEPPVSEDQLPPNVELPENGFAAGIQNRWYVPGINGFALEEAGLVGLNLAVTTSSGTYDVPYAEHVSLPWQLASGVRNVPAGYTVLLQGKEQDTYMWTLAPPAGSNASLADDTTRNPEFVADVAGLYTLTVMDTNANENIELSIWAETWMGVIVGQDPVTGHPQVDSSCTGCHNPSGTPAADQFTPWAETGHANAYTDLLNNGGYFPEFCTACHAVGFDPAIDNNGIDDQSDYQAFLDSGLMGNPDPDNWATMLDQFPDSARLANIQCENCHGPQGGFMSSGHGMADNPRDSISSDMCATCHGEPLRHGRFQQWQISPHANYELAIEESQSGSCSRCHTGNGFLEWLPVLNGEVEGDPTDSITVMWTADEAHPQTCATCHDPHAAGDSSGIDNTATVRISGDTPPLIAGFTATDVGRGAICMTCHNTRRGLYNDQTWPDIVGTDDSTRAPHGGAQADVLMGENAFFVTVGDRGNHSEAVNIEDTCATCHMEATPPPDVLSYNQSGTNHTFKARNDICGDCHGFETGDGLQAANEAQLTAVGDEIATQWAALLGELIDDGNSIVFDSETTITDADAIDAVMMASSRGRQALILDLDGTEVGPRSVRDIMVQPAAGDATNLYLLANDALLQAGWNYFLLINDQSLGVHNPTYYSTVLTATLNALAGDITPPGEPITDPAYPDFRFWVQIVNTSGDVIPTQADPACISETVCVSGAVPGRSEVFLRIVGPRPNGYLWPTLNKFTTSKVEIWIEQISTGTIKMYTLAGAAPGFDILEGLFDRLAFLPIAEQNVVRDIDPREDPMPPGDDWMTSSALPGYEVQVQITNQAGEVITGLQENDCIDETICASGAIPGRSEIFVRVVGPKPNGFFWPTLVRFTSSQVEIWIRQASTDQVNYYLLDAASPGNDTINGLFDRMGFE